MYKKFNWRFWFDFSILDFILFVFISNVAKVENYPNISLIFSKLAFWIFVFALSLLIIHTGYKLGCEKNEK